MTVSSSRSRHTDRFVCRDALGASGQSAGYLSPLPQDAVVYGSGESAVVLTRVRPLSLSEGMNASLAGWPPSRRAPGCPGTLLA